MEVEVLIGGKLRIDPDDLPRLRKEGPQEAMRALLLQNAKITLVAEPVKE